MNNDREPNERYDKMAHAADDVGRVSLFHITNKPSGPRSTDELLTIPEVAQLLKISVAGVRRLQEQRLVPFMKIGASIRFMREDIAAYLKRQRVDRIG
jgi:excisionase family DNA binding protein